MMADLEETSDTRARRLVSLSVGFRISGSAPGVGDAAAHEFILDGFTTGLNEHGLAGRVNVTAGSTDDLTAETPLTIHLNLEAGESGLAATPPDFLATLLRIEPSWVPGFHHFIVLRFDAMPQDYLDYLRRFITWREDNYFTESKPVRDWYLWSQRTQEACGPLTRAELAACVQSGIFSDRDLAWSAEHSDWRPFDPNAVRGPSVAEPGNAAAGIEVDANTSERRLPRLIATPVALRLVSASGVVLEGYTTGINENGLGCRVNLKSGRLDQGIVGLHVRISFILPRKILHRIFGKIIRVNNSWVPGMRHFAAIRFEQVDPEDFEYLRRFIDWRTEDFLHDEPPERTWHVYISAEGKPYGPLTTLEILQANRANSLGSSDLIWSGDSNSWIPFDLVDFRLMAPDAESSERVEIQALADNLHVGATPAPQGHPPDKDAGPPGPPESHLSGRRVIEILQGESSGGWWGTVKLFVQLLIITTFVMIVLYRVAEKHLDPRFVEFIDRMDTRIESVFSSKK